MLRKVLPTLAGYCDPETVICFQSISGLLKSPLRITIDFLALALGPFLWFLIGPVYSKLKGLISKIHFYGIWGKTFSWVKDFLDSHSQAVVLNGAKSDKIAVSSGVPQGSVLGLRLILILAYINDPSDQVKSRVRLFADDMAIYLAISSEGESITLQSDVHILELEQVPEGAPLFNLSK